MCRPTRTTYRGTLIRPGEMSEDDAQPLHRGSGGSTHTRKAHRHGKPRARNVLSPQVRRPRHDPQRPLHVNSGRRLAQIPLKKSNSQSPIRILAAMDRLWRDSFGGIYDTHRSDSATSVIGSRGHPASSTPRAGQIREFRARSFSDFFNNIRKMASDVPTTW